MKRQYIVYCKEKKQGLVSVNCYGYSNEDAIISLIKYLQDKKSYGWDCYDSVLVPENHNLPSTDISLPKILLILLTLLFLAHYISIS